MKSSLFGIKIDCLTKAELVNRLKETLESTGQTKVAKLNAEILLKAYNDKQFKEALAGFELVITDGVGVQWAAKYLSIPLSEIPIWRQIQAIIQMVYSGASLVF
jgi:UDP-N-acetyl-D-mannosaminuronic acid transferase (WecB/TagA/CpsF family)